MAKLMEIFLMMKIWENFKESVTTLGQIDANLFMRIVCLCITMVIVGSYGRKCL